MTPTKKSTDTGLTVAVTGPTGEVGRSVLAALERSDRVKRVLGMARRPFDPDAYGWKKVEYRRGDVLDRSTVDDLVADADVVVHLAWIIFGDRDETRKVNLEGSRNVFEATVKSGARRLVYTSSIAAYGFHQDNPELSDRGSRATRDGRVLLLGAEGRARGAVRRSDGRQRHRTVHPAAVHRRRT